MKVFVLEDDPTRILWFREAFFHHELTLVTDAHAGATAFVGTDWDLVCLDHDLGGGGVTDPDDYNTGSEFVREKADLIAQSSCFVIIHSYNPAGGSVMQDELARRGKPAHIAPFRGPTFTALLDGLFDVGKDAA